MKIFISWAGARSRVLGQAMKDWLPNVLPGVTIFHSDDIPKGDRWHDTLTAALQDCHVGIFCVTPESLRSQWMLFEAGALSQQGVSPRLFTYLYGIKDLSGPLSHFQATHFVREDTREMIARLAEATGEQDATKVMGHFEETWDQFEANIKTLMLIPIHELLPEFMANFDNRKTFHEPFASCSNRRWDDRLRRITRVHECLSQSEYREICLSDPYLSMAYKELMGALDTYDMHVGSYLLKGLNFLELREEEQAQLEDARRRIVDLVSGLARVCGPPVFQESFSFESDSSTPSRKDRILEMQVRLREGQISDEQLRRAENSPYWSLDRIVFYLAAGLGMLPDISIDRLVACVKMEEEKARSHELVSGLQPLYYATECLDERVHGPLDYGLNERLRGYLDVIETFLSGHPDRDSGGHIKRRIDSLKQKLGNVRETM